MKRYILILTSLLIFSQSSFCNNYNIRDYGAIGDGKASNTEIFKKVIGIAAQEGGGTIYVPSGKFLTGTIELKSNIILYLEVGAVIIGSRNFDDYPIVLLRYQGEECFGHAPLIYGRDLGNIAVQGKGTINGQGEVWWNRFKLFTNGGKEKPILNDGEKLTLELNKKTNNNNPFTRPCLIEFINCKNIELSGLTLINSPVWTVHPVYCENVNITGITIINPPEAPNTDGINPDSSKDVRISNCYISTGDDCVTIKSGLNEDGRRVGKPSENIAITNCIMMRGHGGVVLGSEMSGGIRNVVVSNCVFNGTDRGIRFKAPRGRGNVIENISFNNIIMHDILKAGIEIDMLYFDSTNKPIPFDITTPTIKNVFISNVSGENIVEALSIIGIPESPVLNVRISNLNFMGNGAGKIENVKGLLIKDSYIQNAGNKPLEVSHVASAMFNNFEIENKHIEIPLLLLSDIERFSFYKIGIDTKPLIPFHLQGMIKDLEITYAGKNMLFKEFNFEKVAKLNRELNLLTD